MNKLTRSKLISRSTGFTLVELLITVAIVAILAAIAYPSYQTYVARTHRNAAKACLSQFSQFMERYYTTNNLSYAGATPDLECTTEGNLNTRYAITVGGLGASTYTITATPTTLQSTRDSRCGTLTLNDAGARGAGDGSDADIAHCW